jgi:hypothetical protein
MTGKMISVTPPNTNTKGVDGFANIDNNRKFISLLFGGENDASGSVNVTFNKLPSWIGGTAKIKVEAVDWTNRTTASNGPRTISESERAVTNNSVSVSVTGCNNTTGYRIYVTPAAAANVNVTCDVNNLSASYVSGSSVPRPNASCGAGVTAGNASFGINGVDITGWNAPGGTHALYNTGTRTVVLNSLECDGSNVTLSQPVTCGSFEIVPDPTSSISTGAARIRQPFSVDVRGKTLFITANSPTVVEIYNIKGGKEASLNVAGVSQAVKLYLPTGVYFATARGLRDVKFVIR